ncbi:MAG: RagB/SusD family nutrient uptake outer membrane protein [Chitinophagaceae bacterium]|nr:RagB/SusD family nutrient uptake outer membrane protein [Chitinophagaceae bacterium]
MKYFLFLLFGCIMFLTESCKKDWLEAKSDTSKFIPTTVRDFQELINNEVMLNLQEGFIEDAGADDYTVDNESYKFLDEESRNLYIWNKDIFSNRTSRDWNNRYQKIFIANVVLEGLEKLGANAITDQTNNIKGAALFYRACAFHQIAQAFAKPYDPVTAETDAGIPLRLSPSLDERISRSTVKETYGKIITDLWQARDLLKPSSAYVTQPNRNCVTGLLARIYLTMNNYDSSLFYANANLALSDTLLDYNTLNADNDYSMPITNPEILLMQRDYLSDWLSVGAADSVLYNSYVNNDLRKSLFFKNNSGINNYRGSYSGSVLPFCGIATDELYLIRSECLARQANTADAMATLNKLLSRRFATGTFVPLIAADRQEALRIILDERRKELPFRNLRWSDLRRLNVSGAAITLKRVIDGTEYTLLPNDKRYVLPIPPDVISKSGIAQNER